jgi:hypothetical protein
MVPVSRMRSLLRNNTNTSSFRFILPIFLHAGIIHLLLNMFAQLSLSAQVCVIFICTCRSDLHHFLRSSVKWALEDFSWSMPLQGYLGRFLGSRSYLVLTLLLRNVLGGNFSLVGVPSVGASGAIFGTLAVRIPSSVLQLRLTSSTGNLGRPRGSLEVPLQTCSQGKIGSLALISQSQY